MKILLKYIARAIKENKGRTLLLVLAIAVSGAMLYSMLAVKVNLEKVYQEQLTFDKGQADIQITRKDSDSDAKIDPKYMDDISSETSYQQNIIETTGIFKSQDGRRKLIHLMGIDLKDYEKGYNVTVIEKADSSEFSGDSIVISKKVADKYSLHVNDTMKMQVGPEEHTLKVYAIFAPTGVFLDESNQLQAIVPFDSMSDWLHMEGCPNLVYIKMKNSEDKGSAIKQLQDRYPDYVVKEAILEKDIDELIDKVSFPLIFSTLMGSIMCFFIIYSSFRVMLMEQLPQIGTFRSLGATKKRVTYIMLAESVILGLLGGIAGGISGIGISYVISLFSIPLELKDIVKVSVEVNVGYLFVCLIFSMVISVFATLAPIFKISKMPVKNVVLNLVNTEKNIRLKRRLIFLPILILIFFIPYIGERKFLFLLIGGLAGVILGIVALIKLLPVFFKLIAELFRIPIRLMFRNVGDIAITNVATDATFLNSGTLLVIGISVILMMNVISTGMTRILVDDVVEIQDYQVSVASSGLKDAKIEEVKQINGVKDMYMAYSLQNVPMPGKDAELTLIDGVSDSDYLKFRNIELKDKTLVDKLQDGRNIILTNTLKKRYGLEKGQDFTLKLNDKKVTYKIIGFSPTYMTAGSFALVSTKNLQNDTEDSRFNGIYIHTKSGVEATAIADELEVIFENEVAVVEVTKEFIESFKGTMDQITFMIKALSILSIFIGLIGIASNQILTFIKRKRSTAIFRSIGMSRKQLIGMLFVESFILGVVGGIVGVIGGYLFISLVPLFFEMGNYAVPLVLDMKDCVIYTLAAIAVVICSNVLNAVKSYNFNIISAIKME